MNGMSWFTQGRGDTGAARRAIALDMQGEEFHGLNMRLAIDAHVLWKDRLQQMLSGSTSGGLEVGHVAADDRCVLGQWLQGEAKHRLGHHREYHELVRTHADFHLLAGDILCDVHDGRLEAAREKLRHSFRQKSDRVQLALVRLYAKAHM